MNNDFRKVCLGQLSGETADSRCLIIGEVAQSHEGSVGMAHSFIDAIANAGADVVKFQTHIAAEESTFAEPWRVNFSKQDVSRYAYWKRMEFTPDQWLGLKKHAEERGLLFMSSPFSEAAFDILSKIGMKVWKVASGEIGNSALVKRIVDTRAPVILSSGLSAWDELDEVVKTLQVGGNPLAVLQCTTEYPCPPEKVGLNVLDELRKRYNAAVGLSDHSGYIFAGLAAVSLGAEVLEIHVALSREMFGPDVAASITTSELAQLVDGVRKIERMLTSSVIKDRLTERAADIRKLFTKSLVVAQDLQAGTVLEKEHIKLKKPGTGLDASHLPAMLGKRLSRDVKSDEFLLLQDVES